ncbi:MAG TPA: cupin domain-containing protein [Bradyrhizobium sp.]|nr:cupin domain-containing protein [Bradyrhizobium sp.]
MSDLIGARIKQLRTSRGISVNRLAATAGVSSGIISQIERDKANPSLNTIEKICAALGVTTDAIVRSAVIEDEDPPFVCRSGNRARMLVGPAPITKHMLSPPGHRNLKVMTIEFPPGSENVDVTIGPGQKAGVVIEGELRLMVAGKTAVLSAGDSFQFSSAVPHSVHNDGPDICKVIWIILETANEAPF